MSHKSPNNEQQPRRIQGLVDLQLTENDLCALRRRGTVCAEIRRGTKYFKLRFRNEDGQQRVRYLGSDPAVAEEIRRELKHFQLHRHQLTNLKQLFCEARKALRRTKVESQPALELIGFYYHGLVIRKVRRKCLAGGAVDQVVE